jgi:hypothetical protein
VLVVVRAERDQLQRGFHVVQVAMQAGEQVLSSATLMKVAAAGAAGGCGDSVDFEGGFFLQDDVVDYIAIEDFGEVGFDQRDGLVRVNCRGHDCGVWGGQEKCCFVDLTHFRGWDVCVTCLAGQQGCFPRKFGFWFTFHEVIIAI